MLVHETDFLHRPPFPKTPRENKNLLKRDPSLPHLHYHLGKNHAICKLGQEGEKRKRGKVRESEPGRGSAGQIAESGWPIQTLKKHDVKLWNGFRQTKACQGKTLDYWLLVLSAKLSQEASCSCGKDQESVSLLACPLPYFFLPHLKKRFTAPAPPSFWAQESAELDVTRRKVLEKKGSWESKDKIPKKFGNPFFHVVTLHDEKSFQINTQTWTPCSDHACPDPDLSDAHVAVSPP